MRQDRIGFLFLTPALIAVVLFYLLPVVMTAVFAFTNMSTSTGIRGGDYMLTEGSLRDLREQGLNEATLSHLADAGYVVDAEGLAALAEAFGAPLAERVEAALGGQSFATGRDLERALRDLRAPEIRMTRDRKRAADLFQRSVLNIRHDTAAALAADLSAAGIPQSEQDPIVEVAYTGWSWTTRNFELLLSLPSTARYAINTLIYVALTLVIFNVGLGLFLAISTFYLPERTAATFRAIWFMPRILPPVLYVLMWKWLMWDNGFLASALAPFGVERINWMMHSEYHAWVAVILINGVVGASFGMIIFASAIKAIPQTMLLASEVDGATRWQQVRFIILPQMRWPILFVTAYQTLSLLASFEYILLSTGGGPGSATEVWAMAAFRTALNNYGGNLQYGMGATFALVLVIIGTALSLLYLRFFNFQALLAKPRIER
ncbi:MAG: ABC-type inositol-phosphate uptake system permease component InoF [Rhodobacteraceae bacterium HLUCCA08]|nr:MAG: ABC-type inositol-phosphate uptake system permease component InoF [Rhodobacteraceae bacterium HLUCCA08]